MKSIDLEIKKYSPLSISLYAFFLALLISAVVITVMGYNPFIVFLTVFEASLFNVRGLMNSLLYATPLIFTGLAFAFARTGGVINLGGEGALHLGAIAAAIIGVYLNLPTLLIIPITLLGVFAAGSVYGVIVAWLKLRFNCSEVFVTIMLNYICTFFFSYLIQFHFMEKAALVMQTDEIHKAAQLMTFAKRHDLSVALLFAVATALLVSLFLKKSRLGYEIKVVGGNRKAAEAAGIKVGRTMVITLIISSSIAAMAGFSQVNGLLYRAADGFSPGYGWSGLAVASLAAFDPIGVVVSAFIFGLLTNAGYTLARTTGFPMEFVAIIQAFVVLFVASPRIVVIAVTAVKGVARKVFQKRGGGR